MLQHAVKKQAGQAGFIQRNFEDGAATSAMPNTSLKSGIITQLDLLTDKARVLANGNYAIKRALTSYEELDAQVKSADVASNIESRLSEIHNILDNAIASMRLSIDTLGIE